MLCLTLILFSTVLSKNGLCGQYGVMALNTRVNQGFDDGYNQTEVEKSSQNSTISAVAHVAEPAQPQLVFTPSALNATVPTLLEN